MSDIKVRKLTIHSNDKGDLLKGFLKSENQNVDVNEVYISEIKFNHTKAWKKHNSMTSNLIVAYGEIKIVVLKDDGSFFSEVISKNNYKMITIPPGFWFGFKCISEKDSYVLNIADVIHDPMEVERKPITFLDFLPISK